MNHLAGSIRKLIDLSGYTIIIILLFLLSSCKNTPSNTLTGYVEGQYIYITALISGTLKSCSVAKGATVKEGQLLLTLERDTLIQDLTIAHAKVQEAHDELKNANSAYKMHKIKKDRDFSLVSKDIISKEEYENSVLDYEKALQNKKVAEAKLISLQAQEQKEQWNISQQNVLSPKTALVFDIFYVAGEHISAGSSVMSLLDPTQVKIVFFAPQNLLAKLKINQKIKVTYDGATEPVRAKITYISPKAEYNPPIIYSNEERQRLVFRVEAVAEPDTTSTMHPGQPINVIFS